MPTGLAEGQRRSGFDNESPASCAMITRAGAVISPPAGTVGVGWRVA